MTGAGPAVLNEPDMVSRSDVTPARAAAHRRLWTMRPCVACPPAPPTDAARDRMIWPSLSSLAWLAAGAVAVFWMLGAYNRLVRLRNAIGQAWQQVEALLRRRDAAAAALVAALREPLADEAAALDTWLTALGQVAAAREALSARPVDGNAAEQLLRADAVAAAAQTRVLSLAEQQPASRDDDVAAPLRAELEEADARGGFARQLFNEAVAAYNEAARQYPTRLLARLYGFGTAGRL